MKKRYGFMALAMLAGTLSACGGGTGDQGTAAGTSGGTEQGKTEAVELRIMWWGDQKRADRTNEALRKFEEKHPNVKVIGEFAPSSGYFDKLNTQLASGTAPDVFFLGGNVVDYANKGVLLELEPYVGKELNLSDMDKGMIDYGTIKGKLQHISAGANARGIVVNTELFKKAGMEVPKDGWTWDDYARISKELAEKLGKGYYGTYDFTVDGMDIFLKQRGKQLYDMENNALGFEAKDIEEWFQYWERMHKEGGVVTPEQQVSNPPADTSKSLIVTGRAAMGLISSNQLVAHQNLTKDALTLVQLPRGPKGTAVIFESSQGLSGYAKTKHPKEVAQLMNFFINDPDAAKILGNDRGVPVTAAMRDLLKKEANPVEQIIYDYTSRVSEAGKKEPVKVSYNLPGFTEFSKLAETTVQEIGFGKKDVQKGVEDFYNGTVKIFNNNK
ncbi:family 1 extracellular solute-binding protein [Paenibacillus mucilaginosus 3016]|uniref:Family 1 extracellular solute-binding protein n=1 Tax=Paenibacillus mucilaginosus 3016 TaxID=1116391 RepID=H6NL17_9BACL|nr:extracellular solute-binding protein [Paenibacillus mucilaginosus]AFC29323.1 family 1 extracellular solute-binding protein [Paenibacillus mucilaginosus 3016]WFA18041.1 extracellular solute-binding protein [Paenibacillus mucilaginosus]